MNTHELPSHDRIQPRTKRPSGTIDKSKISHMQSVYGVVVGEVALPVAEAVEEAGKQEQALEILLA